MTMEWPDTLGTRVIVLDFDKTITKKHTRGAIFQTSALADEVILDNFADIEFFKLACRTVKKNGSRLAIATFADTEEESLLSGIELVRRYLDLALDGKSKELIPDAHIEAWNPENRDLNMNHVGKNMHLDNLRKRMGGKKKDYVLFDDSTRNVGLGRQHGYVTVDVDAPTPDDDGNVPAGQGFSLEAWKRFLAEPDRKGGGCVVS